MAGRRGGERRGRGVLKRLGVGRERSKLIIFTGGSCVGGERLRPVREVKGACTY